MQFEDGVRVGTGLARGFVPGRLWMLHSSISANSGGAATKTPSGGVSNSSATTSGSTTIRNTATGSASGASSATGDGHLLGEKIPKLSTVMEGLHRDDRIAGPVNQCWTPQPSGACGNRVVCRHGFLQFCTCYRKYYIKVAPVVAYTLFS